MRQKIVLCILTGLFMAMLTGCGSGGGSSGSDHSGMTPNASASASEASPELPFSPEEAGIAQDSTNETDRSVYDSSKLILRGSITAEATDFDAAVSAIEQQVSAAGGYIENSSTSGNVGYRWASFTIRVPREQFETTFRAVGENCHVTERSRSSENVSAVYYDTETRKAALETKRDRLLALLEKADNMEDIIALESALSDVQYEIESLSGTLRNYDRLILFSTIEVYLNEVRDLSIVPEEDSFFSDLKTAAIGGTRWLISFLQALLLTLVYGWWFFLLIFVLTLLAVRRMRRKQKQQLEIRNQARQPFTPITPAVSEDIPEDPDKP